MDATRATVTGQRSTAGRSFPADPPRVEEIVAVMKTAGESPYALRLRALIVILWRAGLRISEALALAETDLESSRGSLLVRSGKGGKRREVGMDDWGGVSSSVGSNSAARFRSGHFCARSAPRRLADPGRIVLRARTSVASPLKPVYVAGLHPINCVMRTPWRWRVKVCR